MATFRSSLYARLQLCHKIYGRRGERARAGEWEAGRAGQGRKQQGARQKSRWDTRIANALRFIRALRNYFYDIFFLFFVIYIFKCICVCVCSFVLCAVAASVLKCWHLPNKLKANYKQQGSGNYSLDAMSCSSRSREQKQELEQQEQQQPHG